MIGKVGASTSIGGTLRYLQKNESRVAWREGHNLVDTNNDVVYQQMKKTAALSRTDQPGYHYSLSWDVSDNPGRQEMVEAAKFSLRELGLGDHQALIVAHNDHEYKHLHVIANRVHPIRGTAWDKWDDFKKLEQCLRVLERTHGWREVPGRHHQLEGQERPEYGRSLNRFEAEQVKRGEKPLFQQIRETAIDDFRRARSWRELHLRLAEKGLTIYRGSRGTGGKVTDGRSYANLSKIHRDFSMGKLEKRFGPFRTLTQIQRSIDLSPAQVQFQQFERSLRLKKPKAQQLFQHLSSDIQSMKDIQKVNQTIQAFASISSASNPAMKLIQQVSKQVTTQLKQQLKEQSQQQSRGMEL